jgi:hypothetical protein
MVVTAIKIDEYEGYTIHGFPREGAGKHGNNYVKIVRKRVLGKFVFDDGTWDGDCLLGRSVEKRVKEYLIAHKLTLQQKIKELG